MLIDNLIILITKKDSLDPWEAEAKYQVINYHWVSVPGDGLGDPRTQR